MLALCLVLGVFALVNAVASAWALALGALLRRRPIHDGAHRARLLGLVRTLPAAAAALLVAGVFVPAFWILEPSGTDEAVELPLALAGLAGAALVGAAVWRVLGAWVASRLLARRWTRGAERMEIPGVPFPAWRITSTDPIVALVGFKQPQLFISSGVLEALSADELAATIFHEIGHLQHRDNWVRLLWRATPDWLSLLRQSGRLEADWSEAAELAADAHAAGQGREAALDLASVLLKVARMSPAAPPVGALALHDGGDVANRVRRLVCGAAAPGSPKVESGLVWLSVLTAPAAFVAAFTVPQLLHEVHEAAEAFVRLSF